MYVKLANRERGSITENNWRKKLIVCRIVDEDYKIRRFVKLKFFKIQL